MKVTVLDFETNGLQRNTDPLSLGFITFDETMTKKLNSGVLYFYNPDVRLNPEAQAVHGLTREFLSQYEGDYKANCSKLYALMERGILVGHNIDSYDLNVGRNFLLRSGYGMVNPSATYDTMKIMQPIIGKRPKLKEAVDFFGIPEEALDMCHEMWFGEKPKQRWHGASYDVTATALVFSSYLNKYGGGQR